MITNKNLPESSKTRDDVLDFYRGIAIIGILVIHTAFWSGVAYTPVYFQSVMLLVDVPFFFFIAGASATYSSRSANPFTGIIRMFSFFLFIAVLFLVLNSVATLLETSSAFFASLKIWTAGDHVHNILSAFSFGKPDYVYFPVLNGSFWFVPTYLSVFLFAQILIKVAPKALLPLGAILAVVFLCGAEADKAWTGIVFLGTPAVTFIFYLFFVLLGFTAYKKDQSKIFNLIFGFVFICSLVFMFTWQTDTISLQNYKFPPQRPYFIASLLAPMGALLLWNRCLKIGCIVRIGRNPIPYFISQGMSSTLLLQIAPHITLPWLLKFFVCFAINLGCSIVMAEAALSLFVATKYVLKKISRRLLPQKKTVGSLDEIPAP